MKPLLFLSIILLLAGCKDISSENDKHIHDLPPITFKTIEKAIIYEANIRHYSAEGTFNAFTKDIPQLKKIGIDIIWLMPIHPISEKKKKRKTRQPLFHRRLQIYKS